MFDIYKVSYLQDLREINDGVVFVGAVIHVAIPCFASVT